MCLSVSKEYVAKGVTQEERLGRSETAVSLHVLGKEMHWFCESLEQQESGHHPRVILKIPLSSPNKGRINTGVYL